MESKIKFFRKKHEELCLVIAKLVRRNTDLGEEIERLVSCNRTQANKIRELEKEKNGNL